MFENRKNHPITLKKFRIRVFKYFLLSAFFLFISLSVGVSGYMYFAHLTMIDALLNASMILTGMGPIDPMPNTAAKLFASFYCLFSGIAFLSIVAVLLAPIVHRFLHILNLDIKE